MDSEEHVRKALRAIPAATKRAVLELVHQTKRSRIGDLTEEIMDYLRNRFQDGEVVETKIKDEWKKFIIVKMHENMPNCSSSNKGTPSKKTPKKNDSADQPPVPGSPINKESTFPLNPSDAEYDVTLAKTEGSPVTMQVKGNKLRRLKGSLTKDLVRLLLRQTCKRTTASSDNGYWIVEAGYVSKYALGDSFMWAGPLSLEAPLKSKQKRKRSSSKHDLADEEMSPTKRGKSIAKKEEIGKRKSTDDKKGTPKKDAKSPGKKTKVEDIRKDLTPGQKRKLLEKMKMKELAEKEKIRKKRLLQKEKEKEQIKKEKEEEKQRKKKDRERIIDIRKLEAEFMKEWMRPKDDLQLEDLQELPGTSKITTKLQGDMFGDVLMLVEFLNIFGSFYDMKDSITQRVTYDFVEKGLLEHDAEGVFYDIIKFLLQTFLKTSKEETEEENAEEESTNGTNTPEESDETDQVQEEVKSGKVSLNATAAAAWPMLHQGMALDELTIDPFTLSEILRLHVLSSGVKIGGARNLWQRKGGFQFTDDPCVDFRHKERSILTSLHTSCVYDLTTQDKLKILCVLCNQILTLSTTRDYIEDSFDKVKELKRKLRDLQTKEHKRRKLESAERWKRKMEECTKRREDIEKRKKEKEEREGEIKAIAKQVEDKTEQKKKGSAKKSKEPEQPEIGQPKELPEEQGRENVADASNKKEEQTEEEKEEEKQEEQRKREKYKLEENDLIKEIAKHSSVCNEIPLGLDRIYNRYWLLNSVDGLIIEHDDVGRQLAEYVGDEDEDLEFELPEENPSRDDNESITDNVKEADKLEYPRVTLNEIIDLRKSGEALRKSLFMRYRCKFDDEKEKLFSDSTAFQSIVESVDNGLHPRQYTQGEVEDKWSAFASSDDVANLISTLNIRGSRESGLRGKLEKVSDQARSSIDNCVLFRPATPDAKQTKARPVKGDIIDKSLFKNMDDYLEANLCDQLVDFEERLWQGSLGVLKVENRETWRENLIGRINLLLGGSLASKDKTGLQNGGYSVNSESNAVKGDCHDLTTEIESDDCRMDVDAETGEKSESKTSDEATEMKIDDVALPNGLDTSTGSLKTLPLKFIDEHCSKEDSSRCSTPVNISIPLVNPRVKEMAMVLMQIEHGIERKYLKPPLGEDEDRKRERIRELIEAAHTEFNGTDTKMKSESSSNKERRPIKKEKVNGKEEGKEENDDNQSVSSEEALRKERNCLERWETSLKAANNFSQVFVHLNTLDRSVMWDKSVLNARCRLCRKKGDAEMMLLCDGCDRGFHMYCLKPPVKKVPDGDWFCVDCRPKETRRGQRPRKRPVILDEFVDEVDDDMTNADSDVENEAEESEASMEEESQDEEEDNPPVDGHSDFCSVCSNGGDLLCCDLCSRAFHTRCSYPPIRKAPKGDWSCQVCTGADSDLPKARRVATLERKREKLETIMAKELSRRQMDKPAAHLDKAQRKQSLAAQRLKTAKRRYSSPGPGASKKQKVKSEKSDKSKRASSRKSVGDPTAHNSRRQSDVFGRYERRLCSKLLEEMVNADDAEAFLLPVDVQLVPDYLNFIDNPMDFSTVKRNLNIGIYDNLATLLDDVRLIFRNCDIYNPPRSAVARAGSRLSLHFEQRLHELELVVT